MYGTYSDIEVSGAAGPESLVKRLDCVLHIWMAFARPGDRETAAVLAIYG